MLVPDGGEPVDDLGQHFVSRDDDVDVDDRFGR